MHQEAAAPGSRVRWAVPALTLLAAILRVAGAGERSLWLDEAMLWEAARGGPWRALVEGAAGTSAGPFYVALLGFVRQLGDHELLLRAPALLAGILAVPTAYLLGRRLADRRAGLLLAALVTLSPSCVRYARELREYAPALLLAILLLLAAERFLRRPSALRVLPFALLAPLALGVQYGLALLVLGVNGAVLLRAWRGALPRERLTIWLAGQLPALGAVALVHRLALAHQLTTGATGRVAASSYLSHGYWDGTAAGLAELAANLPRLLEFAFPAASLLAVLILVDLAPAPPNPRRARRHALALTPLAVGALAALAGLYPLVGARQATWLVPGLLLLAAAGWSRLATSTPLLPRRVAAASLAVLVLAGGAGTLATRADRGPEHLRPLVHMLAGLRQPGEPLWVYYGAAPAFRYHAARTRASLGEAPPGLDPEGIAFGHPDRGRVAGYRRQLEPLLGTNRRVWLLFSHEYGDEREQILRRVAARRPLQELAREVGARLYVAEPVGPIPGAG